MVIRMSEVANRLNEILTNEIEGYEEVTLTLSGLLDEIDTYIDSVSNDEQKTAATYLQGLVNSIIENIMGGESEEDDEEDSE